MNCGLPYFWKVCEQNNICQDYYGSNEDIFFINLNDRLAYFALKFGIQRQHEYMTLMQQQVCFDPLNSNGNNSTYGVSLILALEPCNYLQYFDSENLVCVASKMNLSPDESLFQGNYDPQMLTFFIITLILVALALLMGLILCFEKKNDLDSMKNTKIH